MHVLLVPGGRGRHFSPCSSPTASRQSGRSPLLCLGQGSLEQVLRVSSRIEIIQSTYHDSASVLGEHGQRHYAPLATRQMRECIPGTNEASVLSEVAKQL